jgi:hypothetical protein
MFVLAIEKEIRAAKTLASFDIYRFFSSELELLRDGKPKFAATDTRSNLWPDILRALLDSVEIAMDVIAPDERKITTLVARRNDIAHGKQVFITDLAYYKEYEAVVLGVMYELTLAVSAKFAAFEEALEAASNPVRG